jgi:hypothetical protein
MLGFPRVRGQRIVTSGGDRGSTVAAEARNVPVSGAATVRSVGASHRRAPAQIAGRSGNSARTVSTVSTSLALLSRR